MKLDWGAILSAAGLLVAGALAYADLKHDVTLLQREVKELQEQPRETECVQILNRRLTAIERRKSSIEKELRSLSDDYGCGMQMDAATASHDGGPATNLAAPIDGNVIAPRRPLDVLLSDIDDRLAAD